MYPQPSLSQPSIKVRKQDVRCPRCNRILPGKIITLPGPVNDYFAECFLCGHVVATAEDWRPIDRNSNDARYRRYKERGKRR